MGIALGVMLLAAAQEHGSRQVRAARATTESADAVLVGAGDIASCDDLTGAEATAKLIEKIPGTVFAAGDLAYPDGSEADFANCYEPTWGRFRERTRPAPGNHEYHQQGASAYARYFGAAAGDPAKEYYSYELGAWHIVVLNSECNSVGGCATNSAQVRWLRENLAQHAQGCKLAYFHEPLFSSGGKHGNNPLVRPLWEMLYAAGAEVVINGTITITNASRHRIRRGIWTRGEGSGNLSWARAGRIRITGSERFSPTAKYGTMIRMEF